ncbi:alkaline phosphatase family protein [Kribbella hippodromi]|uniref:Alkaline phosphatase family protein n=1 Tax=Kribbella hippodromi TaxID=434347 RepID=A0ABN2DRW5_9ACTN
MRARLRVAATAAAAASGLVLAAGCSGTTHQLTNAAYQLDAAAYQHPVRTTTPIKHVVVIFGENISFDHYFGTYPNATNENGTPFTPARHTPKVNGLSKQLLTNNPNAYNPKRLAPSQALTCDQNHGYSAEQKAVNGGKMDKFVENTETDKCTGQPVLFGEPGLVMDYYDGNTVTAMWNYAQHYALSDNSFDSVYGPSTPGAINLISGQTHGVQAIDPKTGKPTTDAYAVQSPDANGIGTMTNDPDPYYDDCSNNNGKSANNLAVMHGQNIGDLLNRQHVTWGWFQGGFKPTGTANDKAVCGTQHTNVGGNAVNDYSPHHEPFQYYQSTANPKHLPPSSVAAIGKTDQANHQYDTSDFDAAVAANNLPAVSFLKAGEYQDGHAGYSDPLDEQAFVVKEINQLQKSKEWSSTAVVLAYDDSDGWYDHVKAPVVNGSHDAALDQAALCGTKPAAGGYADRCGYGPRLPLLVVSPYAKVNHVDHSLTDQTSVLKFIEDNWRTGRIGDHSFDQRAGSMNGMFSFWGHPSGKKLILDPKTGAVVR